MAELWKRRTRSYALTNVSHCLLEHNFVESIDHPEATAQTGHTHNWTRTVSLKEMVTDLNTTTEAMDSQEMCPDFFGRARWRSV